MTFPVVFRIGPAHLDAHLVFELLAFAIGYRYYIRLRKGRPDAISTANRVWILIGAAAGAFLFSRLLGSLEEPVELFSRAHSITWYYANRTIVGALLGGLLFVELTKKLIGEKNSSGDLFTYPLILGMMIGRIGCFLAGTSEPTFGVATSLPWGMNLGDGVSRHPIALYEILFLATLWMGLRFAERHVTLGSGLRFAFFMIGYLFYRFCVDFVKPGFRFDIGLTTIQIACLIGLAYYAAVLAHQYRTHSTILERNHA